MDALTIGLGTMGALAAGLSKFVSGASSARNVQQTSLSGMDSSIASAVDRIAGISNANSAWNAAQAQQQRNWSMQQSQQAMQFNAQQAAAQRDWLEYMSNTAHQREVADLKAAGLNPVLSATGGSGAAVPSGASASAAIPSGASAQADQSANSAIVSLLGHFLQAQNNLQMADVSAKTNLAVADKYTAMSQLVAELDAMTRRYQTDVQAQTTREGHDVSERNSIRSAHAQQAMAAISAAAARYGYDISYLINTEKLAQELEIKEKYPDNEWRVLNDILGDLFPAKSGQSGYSSALGSFGDLLSGIDSFVKKSKNDPYEKGTWHLNNRSSYNGFGSGRGF